MTRPSFPLKSGIFTVALFIAAFILFLPLLHGVLGRYDEGIVLCGGSRVCHGELPYRDFWSSYAPGQYFLLGTLFSRFGESVAVERLLDITVRALLSVACFWLLRLVASPLISFLGFASVALWLFNFGFSGYPVYPALLLALCSIGILAPGLQERATGRIIASALAAGGVTLFRHDLGIVLAGSITIALAAFALRSRFRQKRFDAFSFQAALVFPTIAAVLPLIFYGSLVLAGCGTDMIDQLLLFPRDVFADYRALPYPSLLSLSLDPAYLFGHGLWGICSTLMHEVSFFAFPGIIVIGLLTGVLLFLGKQEPGRHEFLIIVLSMTGLGCVPQVIVRSDFIHLLPIAMIALMLGFVLALRLRSCDRRISLILLVLMVLFGLVPVRGYRPQFSGTIAPPTDDMAAAVDYITRHYPGSFVYAGVENHDRFTLNTPTVYFLAGRGFCTKYHELHPGITTTAAVQRQIIDDLSRHAVQVAVLVPGFWPEPNESQKDRHVDLLDRYIREHYYPVARFGDYRILLRN